LAEVYVWSVAGTITLDREWVTSVTWTTSTVTRSGAVYPLYTARGRDFRLKCIFFRLEWPYILFRKTFIWPYLECHITCITLNLVHVKGAGPRRVKIGPIKWSKLNLSFDKLFSAWKIGHIWWFIEMVKVFEFFAIVSKISRNPWIWSKLRYFCYKIFKFHIQHSLAPSSL
jgi:hypothetical protein